MEYVSSDGTKKPTSSMNTEYVINALAKNMRGIFGTQNVEEFNRTIANIQLLENEFDKRANDFLQSKIEEW